MGDPIDDKVNKILDERLKGGKSTMTSEKREYCPTCGAPADHRHIQTDLEIEKDRHQHDMERATVENQRLREQFEIANSNANSLLSHIDSYPKHPEGCIGDSCQIIQGLHRIAENAKKNITPDDLNINLVGEYFKRRGIFGVAKRS